MKRRSASEYASRAKLVELRMAAARSREMTIRKRAETRRRNREAAKGEAPG